MHNVVYVATQHNSLYAIDSNTGVILWQDALLTPEHGGTVTSVPNSAVGSGDITPEIGITATPAIDPTTNTIFVENKSQEVASDGTHFEHHLYAINIASGAITNEVLIADSIGDTVVSGPSVKGNGSGNKSGVVKFDALRQLDRPAVTLVNANVYLSYASHGDNGPYHGWILGYSTSTLALTAVFNANPNGSDDGIWQGGGQLAYETVNGNTFLYFETGNGTFDTTLTQSPFTPNLMIPAKGDYGDSFVKVEIDGSTPAAGSLNATNNINGWGMHVADYFTPMNEGNLSAGDTDLGSGAPLLLPATAGSAAHPDLMVGAGKEGRIYLIDRDNMGGYGGDAAGDGNSGSDNIVQETGAGAINGSLDTPTFYNGVLYFVGGYSDRAKTFTIANGVMSSTFVTQSPDVYSFPGSTPTITTNPSGGNAIAWDIAGPGKNELRAYNASQGYSAEIYTSSQAASSRDALGSAVKFTVATVADGQVFVGTTNSIVVYGLLQQTAGPPAAPTNLSASAFSGSVINLSWTDNDSLPSAATGYNIFESTDGTNFNQVGTASAGATSFPVGSLQINTKYYFEVSAFNSKGTSVVSNIANATTTGQASVLDFSSGFSSSASALSYNGSAKINGTSAQLTDTGTHEAGSVFSTNVVDITKFSNQFKFQLTNPNADGFTFTIQGVGPSALGASGSALGYGGSPGIAKSVAVKFDLFSNADEGADSTGEYTNGAAPTTPATDLTSTGVNLHSGDVFQVLMSYDGMTLTATIMDMVTHATASQSYTVNIPQVVGGNSAYVGFTGGTGGATAVQNILTWTFSPTASTLPAAPTNLTGSVISGSEIDLSWTNNANNATNVLIYRSSDGVNFSQIGSVSATQNTYHDLSLSPGHTYNYEVQASNAAGVSGFSNIFTQATDTPPDPPTELTATNITTTEVDLSWVNVATNATGIKILKQLGSNSAQVIASGLPPTTTSFNITGLTAGTPYIFEIDALNSNGPSGAAEIAVDTLPAQVTEVTATPGAGQITISWDDDGSEGEVNEAGAVNYNIYRSTTPAGEGTSPMWTAVAGTSFVDGTVVPGTTYYYTVTGVDPNSASPTDPMGESAQSDEVSAAAQPGSVAFNPPSNLVGAAQNGPQVQLTWTTNSTTGTGFTIERATDAAFTDNVTNFSAPATSGATATYTDTTVVPDNTYFYRVQALNGAVETAFSNVVTENIPAPPATPSNGHATSITATTVNLAWTNNATNADVYKIFREIVGGTFTQVASLPPTATTFNDINLTPGTNYDYHIEAWNISGPADRTGADLFTVSPAITSLSVSTRSGQPVLSWTAPPGGPALTYNVYRGTSAGGESATPLATGLTTPSFTDTSANPGTTYFYEVTSVDPASLATPSVAPFGESAPSNEVSTTPGSGTASPPINFSGGFTGAKSTLTLNGSAALNGAKLELTNGGALEASSAFSTSAIDISKFVTQFTFQTTAGSNTADGFTFTIQGMAPTALGSRGGALGYSIATNGTGTKIGQSVAIKFDLFDNAGEGGDSTGLFMNGAVPTKAGSINLSPSGVDLHSGDPMQATLVYDGTTLTVMITDTVMAKSATQTYTVNIPSFVGGTSGFVGFTGGTGAVSSTQDILNWTFLPAPGPPSALQGTAASGNSVTLSWTNNATDQAGFQLDRATDSAFTQNMITQALPGSPNTFTDTASGLVPGGTYFYRIRATNAAGASANSTFVQVGIPAIPPAATNAAVTAVTTGEIDLSWTDNAGPAATGYVVQRSVSGGAFANYATLPASTNAAPSPYTWSDTNVVSGTAYDYHIVAFNVSGSSNFLDANATTLTLPPSGLTATAVAGSVNLSWAAPTGAVTYNVYRGTASGGETLLTSGVATTSYIDSTGTAGTTYFYTVTAVNNNANLVPAVSSESAPSNEAAAAPLPKTLLDFSGGFAGSTNKLTYNGSVAINGNKLELTNGGALQAGSAFSSTAVHVSNFTTQFTFKTTAGSNTADGFTFTIQGVGPTALGSRGGALGYSVATNGTGTKIGQSVAVKFDLFDNSGEGANSTGLYTNGAVPTNTGSINLTPSGINLHNGNPILAQLTYDGTTLTVTLTDTVTHATATQTYTVNIPNLVGGSAAYVGFTGGSGAVSSTQDILNWTFTPAV
ncbi:MAG TPA: fibronectin type III domain-containing protein [Planctomycetaceae bacterium]|nr:fibronectin type III domain-containing protein [Planctomycetaceae bacterium]